MEHPGYMELRDDEMLALAEIFRGRRGIICYRFGVNKNGHGFEEQMRRVLPAENGLSCRSITRSSTCVFDLKGPIKQLQVPTIQFWNRAYDPKDPNSALTTSRTAAKVLKRWHVRGVARRQTARIMAIATLNSDVSDGWERETENEDYFKTLRRAHRVSPSDQYDFLSDDPLNRGRNPPGHQKFCRQRGRSAAEPQPRRKIIESRIQKIDP